VSKGELILYFANIQFFFLISKIVYQFFLQLFEISEVSISEWVAQAKVNFVQPPHPSRSQIYVIAFYLFFVK
jgi:hypothetical protein